MKKVKIRERIRIKLARLLGKWPKTVLQARDWLKKQGLEEEEAGAILEDFLRSGLLDDAAYARLFVQGHPGWGVYRLRHELKRRGVPDVLAGEAIDEAHDPAVIEALVKDWKKSGIDDRRIAGRLARRGFPAGEAMAAIRSSCPGNE